jgi:putative oxidoreductase
MAKSQGKVYIGIRVILGLLLLTLGLNVFFRFLPMPEPPPQAQEFLAAIGSAEYFFPMLGIIETLTGLMLLVNFAPALAAVMMFPILICANLYHLALFPEGILFAIVCLILDGIIILFNFGKYMPMLER